MKKETFLKWGALAAIVFVLLAGFDYISGGPNSDFFVPLFSCVLIFRFIAALAGYELIARTHYGLARVGLGFAYFAIVMMFLEAAVWGAKSSSGIDHAGMVALFDSLHLMVLWFVALWVLCWGIALVQGAGIARVLGGLFIFHFFVNLLRYFTIQFELDGVLVSINSVVGPVTLLGTYLLLGIVLWAASQATQD